MDKTKLNFIIDALMFLVLMALAGLGFLMKYTLPPGREVWAKYGRNVDLTWLGWDRHDWGSIHLYLAFTLLGLLAVHLVLHWSMILGLLARLLPDPKMRTRVALAFLIIALLLIYFPFIVTPQEGGVRGRGGGGGRHRSELGAHDRQVISPGETGTGCGACPDLACRRDGQARIESSAGPALPLPQPRL
jgi:hypothetical protein